MVVQMFYTIYKITNLINGKIYIGAHKTNNLEDNYYGSGYNIKKAIEKYGKENFKKEYIFIVDSLDEMYDLEKNIVNEDFIKRKDTYNMVIGGEGGWVHVNKFYYTNEKRIEHGKKYGKLAGSWKDKEKRMRIWSLIPLEKRIEHGKKLGAKYGGKINKLNEEEITRRLELIKDIDLSKFGWVSKVSKILKISHTQVSRFMKNYYKGYLFKRKTGE